MMVLGLIVSLACGSDAAWRAKLAESDAPRLVGLWNVYLRADHLGASARRSPTPTGQIALTLNEERLASAAFSEPPMFFGTYNIDFAQVGLNAGIYAGFPAVVGKTWGDSIMLKLATDSKVPVELRGFVAGDSVVGRWEAQSRAGSAGAGDFLLLKR